MTSADIAFRIQADLGLTWPRNRPLPNEAVAEICEALAGRDQSESPHRAAANAGVERPCIRARDRGVEEAKGALRARDSCRLCVAD